MPALYLLERLAWELDFPSGFVRNDEMFGVPLAAFASETAARAECERLEAEARQELSPFAFCASQVAEYTSLPYAEFLERLGSLGFAPPRKYTPDEVCREGDNWEEWWDRHAPTMTEAQRQGVWKALDKLHFYRVRRVLLED